MFAAVAVGVAPFPAVAHANAGVPMIGIAYPGMGILLIPFFFVSWLIEYYVSRLFMREVERKALRQAVLRANLVSYGLLAAVALIGLGVGIFQQFGT